MHVAAGAVWFAAFMSSSVTGIAPGIAILIVADECPYNGKFIVHIRRSTVGGIRIRIQRGRAVARVYRGSQME